MTIGDKEGQITERPARRARPLAVLAIVVTANLAWTFQDTGWQSCFSAFVRGAALVDTRQ